jgi:hypothetical protein
VRLIPANSSNLSGFAFDTDKLDFYVCFVDGRVYRYPDTRPWDVTNIVFAESQGKAFNAWKHGKQNYEVTDETVLDVFRL